MSIRKRFTNIEKVLASIIITGAMAIWVWILRDWMSRNMPDITFLNLGIDEWLLIGIPVFVVLVTLAFMDKDKIKGKIGGKR